MYMSVCIYAYARIYMYTYVYLCIRICKYIRMYIHIYIYNCRRNRFGLLGLISAVLTSRMEKPTLYRQLNIYIYIYIHKIIKSPLNIKLKIIHHQSKLY